MQVYDETKHNKRKAHNLSLVTVTEPWAEYVTKFKKDYPDFKEMGLVRCRKARTLLHGIGTFTTLCGLVGGQPKYKNLDSSFASWLNDAEPLPHGLWNFYEWQNKSALALRTGNAAGIEQDAD